MRPKWLVNSSVSIFVSSRLSVRLALCLQEAGRLPPSAGCWRLSPDESARLEVCLHVHPRVLPLPGGERPCQNQKAIIDSFHYWLLIPFLHSIQVWWLKTQYDTPFSTENLHFVCFLRGATMEKIKYLMRVAVMRHVNVNAQCGALVSMWVYTGGIYGCLCALTGQLVLRISTFHWDYTSALIPVSNIENLWTNFIRMLRAWLCDY